jgi:hypothetical protein
MSPSPKTPSTSPTSPTTSSTIYTTTPATATGTSPCRTATIPAIIITATPPHAACHEALTIAANLPATILYHTFRVYLDAVAFTPTDALALLVFPSLTRGSDAQTGDRRRVVLDPRRAVFVPRRGRSAMAPRKLSARGRPDRQFSLPHGIRSSPNQNGDPSSRNMRRSTRA